MQEAVTDREVAKLLKMYGGKGDQNIGQKVGNNVVLLKKLGQGAMGAVYLGADVVAKRWVAVKVLLREKFELEAQFQYMKDLLIKEGVNLVKVEHPGIVLVYGVDAEYPALIMKHIDGMTFHEYLYQDEVRNMWGVPAFRQWFTSRMLDLAEALRFAHSHGLIHKDLKPSNIMISQDEHGQWTKMTIIDFGLAQDNRKIKLTDGESVIGTPSYMALEQWADRWNINMQTDVFSFGVILYEVLMQDDYYGRDADIPQIMVNAKNSGFLQSRVGHLPIDQRTIFELCLASDRAQRAGGMWEVIGLIRSLQLALEHREREFPGTSFPSLPGISRVSVEPVPNEGLSKPKESKPVRGGTILGPQVAPEVVPASAPVPQADVSFSIVVEQPVVKPASEPVQATPEPQEDLREEPMVVHDEHAKRTRKTIWIMLLIAAVLFTVVFPLLYSYFNDKKEASEKEHKQVVATKKVEPPKEVPKKVEPTMAPTEVPKKSETKPSIPVPPKVGEFPSNEYATYMFNEWDKWCAKNDARRTEFDKFPMWRAICLRKKVVELYSKNRSNPETAVAMADEIWAHMCFRVSQDKWLAKECEVLRDLAYKKFTYFLAGKRIEAVDKFLTDRKPRRLQIQEEWKAKNQASSATPPTTP